MNIYLFILNVHLYIQMYVHTNIFLLKSRRETYFQLFIFSKVVNDLEIKEY